MNDRDAQRHFGGWYTRLLIGSLRAQIGSSGVARVLREAGEQRPTAVLSRDATWSSYGQFRRLLEAAAETAGLAALTAAGARIEELSEINRADAVRTLGSPDAMYANMATAASSVCSILHTEPVKVADREWLLRQTLTDGFAPFAELCAFQAGVHQIGARVFGYPGVHVVEEQCARLDADACVFRVRWEPVEESVRDAELLRRDVKALESQLDQFQRTVADLVSGQDLQTVLDRTFAAATHAVRAEMFVLALDSAPSSVRHIYTAGVDAAEAADIADEILTAAADNSAHHLVADVTSPRRRYGRLAAIRPTAGFLPHEAPRLQAYAGFIAAALDSASALDESRRQSDTAKALLELATALADITSVEEMAAKLVRAVPDVMGSNRAAVLLRQPTGEHARIVATYGYPPDLDRMLKGRNYPISTVRSGQPTFRQRSELDPHSPTATQMAETGTTAHITIPIVVDGEWAGEIYASMSGDPAGLDADETNKDRLKGLAAQASTAIRNAHLLDQVRHQAFHDTLTGLPNRALILDRTEQLLARARRNNDPVAAMFIDLDGFKEINDTFGHAAGDELLRAVTGRLTAILRPSDTLGRLGGDEFVVLLDGTTGDTGPEHVAERILAALREPFDISERNAGRHTVTASIGIATGGYSPDDLLRDADIALYQAKAAGKNCFAVFGTITPGPAACRTKRSRTARP